MTHRIANDFLELELSEQGNLLAFRNRLTGTNFTSEHGWWRLVFGTADRPELEVKAEDSSSLSLNVSTDSFALDYENPCDQFGTVRPLKVTVTGKLQADELHLSITITSHLPAPLVIRECHFPIVRLTADAESMSYHQSENGGLVWDSLASHRHSLVNRSAPYQAMDYLYSRRIATYPGASASTNCFTLNDGQEGLYLGNHEPLFETTCHITELEAATDSVNLIMAKFPFLKTGESRTYGQFILSAYSGKWPVAAAKYRRWMEGRLPLQPIRPELVGLNGWQRIIMRSQYGENFYTYDRLPEILNDGLSAGIDTLLMFGWHRGGHDNDYPNYVPSDELGGTELLKQKIHEFKQGGGKIFLYTNGELIDRAGDFYRNGPGKNIAAKDIRGIEYSQTWGFSGRGVYNSCFGGRSFAHACPGCPQWLEVLKHSVDIAVDLGCDGIFYDELGCDQPVCCDPSHGHPIPFIGVPAVHQKNLERLRDYAHSKGISIGIEHATDLTALSVDYVHTCGGGNAAVNPDWEQKGEKPIVQRNQAWFHCAFPEIPISNREIREDRDIERRVNRLLLTGVMSDVEVYRCQRTIAALPHYQHYLRLVNDFRQRNPQVYQQGRYCANACHDCDSTEVDSEGFILPDGAVAVALTQSHRQEITCHVTVPGKAITHMDILGHGTCSPNGDITLKKNALMLLYFA